MAIENYAGNYGPAYVPRYTSNVTSQCRTAYNPQFGNESADSFEHSGGGLGGVGYTALGAGAGATAGYFLMGNPISEGENGLKVNERFYKSYDRALLERTINKNIKLAELDALETVNIANHDEFNALKKLAKAESLESLPDEVKNALPKEITTPDEAKALVSRAEAELAKIDKKAIAQNITKVSESGIYITSTDCLNASKNFGKAEAELAKLADDIKPSELKDFITKNKELFNLKGEEAAITAEIERLSNLGKADLLKYVGEKKAFFTGALADTEKAILSEVSKESKSLVADAPEYLKNAFKDFKWSQAKRFGLWGAATALGAYALSSLFGGGSKKKS